MMPNVGDKKGLSPNDQATRPVPTIPDSQEAVSPNHQVTRAVPTADDGPGAGAARPPRERLHPLAGASKPSIDRAARSRRRNKDREADRTAADASLLGDLTASHERPVALIVVEAARDAERPTRCFEELGWEVVRSAAGSWALSDLTKHQPDLIYVDAWSSSMDAMSFLDAGRRLSPTLPSTVVLVLPEEPPAELLDLIGESDVAAALPRDWQRAHLESAIERARLPELPVEALGSDRSFLDLARALYPDEQTAYSIEILPISAADLGQSTAEPEAALPIGTLIQERYRVEGFLGRGATANVYKVDDTALGEVVALKLLTQTTGESPRARERFRLEMRICRSLLHPSIVRSFEFGKWEDRPFFTMELLRGETLRQMLLRNRWEPVPLPTALRWIRQASEGLAVAHQLDIVHRDIKPENLFLLAGSSDLKITDFGIARSEFEGADTSIDGMVLGTPAYLSPEQLLDSGPVSKASDVFALGIIAWELLAGRHPFYRQDMAGMMQAVATEPAPKLRSAAKKVPRKLEALIHRMIDKAPKRRPAHAGDVLAELDRLGL